MLKLINHIIKEDNTCHGASLQVRQFTQNCAHEIATTKMACILNNSELSRIGDWATRKNWWYQWLYCSSNFIFYSKFQAVAGITFKALTTNKISSPEGDARSFLASPLLAKKEAIAVFGNGAMPNARETSKTFSWGMSLTCIEMVGWSKRIAYYSRLIFYFLNLPKSDDGKFHHQYKLLGEKRRGNWGYKINAQKDSSKDIKEESKLYRSILGKYRYTSLKLAVRWRSHSASCASAILLGRLPCSIGIGEGLLLVKPSATYGRSLYGLCTTNLLWARLPCSIGIGDKLSWGNKLDNKRAIACA